MSSLAEATGQAAHENECAIGDPVQEALRGMCDPAQELDAVIEWRHFISPRAARDDPDRVDDAGEVAQDRQQDVEPELPAQAYGEEHADGWQEDGENDA